MRIKTLIVLCLSMFLTISVVNGLFISSTKGESTDFQGCSFTDFVEEIFENVRDLSVNQCRYGAKDDHGYGLDTIKIIENPEYLGIYHSQVGGTGWLDYQVRLAISNDLLIWSYNRTIELRAAQPTIAIAPNGAYLIVFEKHEQTTSHLKFHYYSNLSMLAPNFTYDAPRTLSTSYEGTPNIYNITIKDSTLNACIGFHYDTGYVDNVAIGWLAIPLDSPKNGTWNTKPQTKYNQKLREEWNIEGNIGDRDYEQIFGRNFTLQEANLKPRPTDYAAWRIFLYDHSDPFYPLDIKTHKGSTSFGNPTFTFLKSPNGKDCIVVTYFLFSEGAETGEAGELIFYKEFETYPPYPLEYEGKSYPASITTNSTITSPPTINESEKTINFNVSGADYTRGYCIIKLPNNLTQDLWKSNFTVLIDRKPVQFENWTDLENTYIYISYIHSAHEITIIPELSMLFSIIFMLTTFVVVLVRKMPSNRGKKRARRLFPKQPPNTVKHKQI